MNIYSKIYFHTCEKNKKRISEYGYGSGLHRHRILPGHMGGQYVKENCTYVTPREHKILHFLLWKIYGNVNDLRSLYMLGGNLSSKQRIITGKWCYENGIGFHNSKWDHMRKEWSLRGYNSQKESKDENSFYYWSTPEGRKKRASLGGKKTFKNKSNPDLLYWCSREGLQKRASLGGKSLKGRKAMYKPGVPGFKRVKTENQQKMLELGYKFGMPKGAIAVHNPNIPGFKRIDPKYKDSYLKKGYILGSGLTGMRSPEGKNLKVNHDEVDSYLSKGYMLIS